MSPYRILLADDHAVFRSGLRRLIEEQSDLVVVAEAASGQDVLVRADEHAPDVIVLDVQMPGMNGMATVRTLREREHPARILGLSAYDDVVYVEGFARGGASGYVTKDRSPALIVQAIRQVAEGQSVWLLRHPISSPLLSLTEREREVLALLGEGLTNDEMAARLYVSESTIRNTLTGIYDKIGVTNARSAVAWAWRNRLVDQQQG